MCHNKHNYARKSKFLGFCPVSLLSDCLKLSKTQSSHIKRPKRKMLVKSPVLCSDYYFTSMNQCLATRINQIYFLQQDQCLMVKNFCKGSSLKTKTTSLTTLSLAMGVIRVDKRFFSKNFANFS